MSAKKPRAISSLEEIPAVAIYFARIDAKPRSLFSGYVSVGQNGYHKDICIIRFTRDGEVDVTDAEFAPNDRERSDILEAFRNVTLPTMARPKMRPSLPKELLSVDPTTIFNFTDPAGNFVMLQQRIDTPDGRKRYVAWTFWDDQQWRKLEPEGDLPLWGLDQLKNAATVFIHEGAKAARFCREMVEGKTPDARERLKQHPWGEELAHAAHLGWIGGATNPGRTDWSVLAKAGITRAYIVSDNDEVGRAAVAAISQAIRIPAFHIQFTDEWPTSFDLGDDFPTSLYKTIGNVRYYIGPPFQSVLHPVTWATDLWTPPGQARPIAVLRHSFQGSWIYVQQPQLFVAKDVARLVLDRDALNDRYRALSHSPKIAEKILEDYRGTYVAAAYRPDLKPGPMTDTDRSAYNLFTPSIIRPQNGDPEPWLEYLRYLIPDDEERHQLMRWCATLIAKPATRMLFGLLLVSERHGTGKTTLGASVLSPIVGSHNCSYPSEADIVGSQFNSWAARKRLIVVGEIYSGHSWQAYNKLKSVITDPRIRINEKHRPEYEIDNFAHIIASSNSRRPLKMDASDRRWFYPTITEEPWPKSRFSEFYDWIDSGGLPIIANWAHHFTDYVGSGESAPRTTQKDELIEDSRSAAQHLAIELADTLVRSTEPVCLAMRSIEDWVRSKTSERMYDGQDDLRRAMKAAGARFTGQRIKIVGAAQFVAFNAACEEAIRPMCAHQDGTKPLLLTDEARAFLRAHLITPSDLARAF